MILRNQQDPRYIIKKNRPVYVYKNLHKDCWSIKQHGLVKAHIPQGESIVKRIDIAIPKFRMIRRFPLIDYVNNF